jgi:polysaccharide deacetylase family protein (PEP-CTERM system associated)
LDNILTVDVEEWYHPEYVKRKVPIEKEARIPVSLEMTLSFLAKLNAHATFFVVGELVEKHPDIIDRIKEGNHEIGFHGFYHEPLWHSDPKILRTEIERFNNLIKEKCAGFRAPSFSLNTQTRWLLRILEDCGYQYDSSLFPVKTPLYGMQGGPTAPYKPSLENIVEFDENARLWEFPLLVYRWRGVRVPVAGGFYLRFFPANMIAKAIKKSNKQNFPAVIFFHNWELDPETPRLKLGLYKHFVTYHKLKETSKKLENLLSKFTFVSIKEYVNDHLL